MADKRCPTCDTTYPVAERFCPKDGSVLRLVGSTDLIGTVIAERYHVIRKLGEGGMGQVYLAEHMKMGRMSALKLMQPSAANDAEAISRFHREAANASRISHPNVGAIYDFGETADGSIFLAMEFVEGETLKELLEREGPLPLARAAGLIQQIAAGLGAAHALGIVHRDLKPDNIMVARSQDGTDQVKVVDFGIAKSAGQEEQSVTRTGMSIGTPEYMSPEQLAAERVAHTSDLYSLGLIAFAMLAGRLPFEGATPQESMLLRLTAAPRSLAELRPEVAWPDTLLECMQRALALRPEDRFQSATAFGEAIAGAAAEATLRTTRPTQIFAATRAAGPATRVPSRRVRWAVAAPILALAGLGYVASVAVQAARRPVTAIAVLPFESVGGDTSNAYFAVGIAEEISLALSRVSGVRLAGRNSAAVLRERNASLRQIGRELNVGTVLQGSVRRSGTQLRVTAELTRTGSGEVIWADRYERTVDDVFSVQDEITRELVAALRLTLTGAPGSTDAPRTTDRGTESLAAYDEYLRGLYQYSRRGERIPKAVEHFTAAITEDPEFARAWAGLGLALAATTIYRDADARTVIPRAVAAAERAIALDPRSAEAYLAMGVAHAYANRWAAAEEAYTRALALDSTLVLARMHYGRMLFTVGRVDESLQQLERGQSLDPLNANLAATLATGLSRAGRDADALVVARRAFELDSTVNAARGSLLQTLVVAERDAEARSVAERILRYVGTDLGVKGQVAYALGRGGDTAGANALIAEIERETTDSRRDVALLRASLGVGDSVRALAALQRLVADERPFAVSMEFQTVMFDPIRSSRRYQDALRAVGLDPARLAPK